MMVKADPARMTRMVHSRGRSDGSALLPQDFEGVAEARPGRPRTGTRQHMGGGYR